MDFSAMIPITLDLLAYHSCKREAKSVQGSTHNKAFHKKTIPMGADPKISSCLSCFARVPRCAVHVIRLAMFCCMLQSLHQQV